MKTISGNLNNAIIMTEKADLNGDGVMDTIYLTGYKENPNDIFIRNITVVIEDGKTKRITSFTFENNAGYNSRLFLGDFTGDNIPEIFISIDSGGSGGFGFYYLYSFKNSVVSKLFDNEEFNNTYKYEVVFRENCIVAIYSEYFRKTYYLDVSARKEFYQEQGVYNANCRLLKPVRGFVPGLNNLYPLESGISGRYNLLAVQRIIGLFGADTLGYIETTLAWDGSMFRAVSESVTTV